MTCPCLHGQPRFGVLLPAGNFRRRRRQHGRRASSACSLTPHRQWVQRYRVSRMVRDLNLATHYSYVATLCDLLPWLVLFTRATD